MAAEIGRTASKHLSTECGKATSLSSPGGDVGFDSSRVIVETEQQQQQQEQLQHAPQRQLSQQDRNGRRLVQVKKLGKTTTTSPPSRNRVPFATAQPAAGNDQQQEQQQQQVLINADNVTSTAEAVTEVPGAIKTTINIGFAMNHVNDQENLKQLSLAPVQVNEVEEMDTQEETPNDGGGDGTDNRPINGEPELACIVQDQEMEEDEARSEATFRYTVENISKMKDSQLSPAFYVRNLPWKIKVCPPRSSQTQERQRSLGFYLQCNGESESTSWSCYAVAELRLLSCKEGQEPFSRKIEHLFNSKENDWGFRHFMTWQAVLNPDRGFIKDDSITLEVHVVADAVLSSSAVLSSRSISCLISDMTLLIEVSDYSCISTEAFIIHCKIKNFHQLISNTIHMNLQASVPVFKEVKSLEDSTFEFASKDESFKFIVGEEEYDISKKKLCDTNSSYFKNICLTYKGREINMATVLTRNELQTFKQVLLYITTNSIDQGDYKMLKKLLTAADKYDVPTLKLTCQHYLLRSLTIENAVELVQLASSSNAKFLETHSVTY